MNFCGYLSEFSNKEMIIKGAVRTELISCGDNSITVNMPEQKYDVNSIIAYAVLDYDHKYVWYSTAKATVGQNVINFDSFDFLVAGKVPVRYKLYAVFQEDGILYFRRLYNPEIRDEYKETGDRSLLYYDVINESQFNNEKAYLGIHITTGGFYAMNIYDESEKVNYKITNVVNNFKIEDDCFCFDVRVEKFPGTTEYSLVVQESEGGEESYYDVPKQPVTDNGDFLLFSCKLDRHFADIDHPAVLHLYTRYVIDGRAYYTRVKTASPELSEEIRQLSFDEFDRFNDDLETLTIRSNLGGLQFISVAPNNSYDYVNNSVKDTIMNRNIAVNRIMYGTQDVTDNGEYKIYINADMSSIGEIAAFGFFPKAKEKVILDITAWDKRTGELTIDLSNLEETCQDFTSRSYMLCIAFEYKGRVYPAKFKSPAFRGAATAYGVRAISNRVFDVVKSFMVNGVKVTLAPMYTYGGYFYIRVREELLSRKDLVSVKYNKLSFEGSNINVTVKAPKDKNFTGFVFTYRYKKSEDRLLYFVDGEIKKGIRRNKLSASIDLSKFELKRVIWDLYAVFEENGVKYAAPIKIRRRKVNKILFDKKRIERQAEITVETEEGEDSIFPYYTAINTVAFLMREKNQNDCMEFRQQEFEALKIFKKNRKKLLSQNIILVYEKYCSCAQDNGYVFFKHCMEHDAEKILDAKIYYIIDKNASDYERVKMYDDHVIDFLSLDHMVYLLAAKLLVSSDSKPHSYVWRPNNSIISDALKDKDLFFLQHGVTALKRVDHVFGKKSVSPVSRFVATSADERSIIINNFGYKPNEVSMTGFARWDDLEDKSKDYNEILIMPTWRSWLDECEDSAFLESDYYKNYEELLTSKRLQKLLEENDLVFNFYIHPKFKDFINSFSVDNDRIRLIPYGEEPLNELMMRCKLLITDYSSVCWDVYYMNKPVLFYQFDYELYNTIHGSYLNMETDLFGYRSFTIKELLDDFEKSIKNGFKQPKKFDKMRESKFAFTDKNNSARIVREIKKMDIFED